MRENLRWIRSLLAVFGRSGRGVFVCSLAVGLVLGGSSVVCLEILDERRGQAYRGGGPSGTGEDAERGERNAARPETTKAGPTEEARTSSEPRRDGSVREDRGPEPDPDRTAQETRPPEGRELEAGLREITSRYPGDYGVVLWQPESGTRISLDAGKRFRSASLAKLPVLLALYREAAEGRLSLDERIQVSASDIRPGTGVLQDRPPGTALTLRECAEYLIKESDNTAWAMLEDRLGKKRIRAELARAGTESTKYEYARHTTTPDDTLKVLQKISDPGYTSPSHSQEMLEAMTGTAFEDRLPQGLPADARIQHKIGSLGDNFGDAGLVIPPEGNEYGGPYYVVVLSRNAGGEATARRAMREISLTAYQGLADPEARPRSPIPGSGSERRQQ
ncbi:hypothetical protein BH24ACT16_BH24ACT16_03100 [soil metagenome]